ncbi:hypothetical protein Vretimale_7351 [Volvox reticuliferus]|uniref:Uncharacterized protein n=1 Tax=Volvox reticuliferus TaxID=1737510 RepID=A0A8J4FJR9_9CHLO|nr:hypothetical protein Vretifemale_7460 [Volvox reticuliferus]GIM02535.1 hypothetical protein Vretimale_7351 [Volvox reticuliferus]
MDDQMLIQLLEKACPRPSYLAPTDGGPILALALHCLMVNDGFILASEGGQSIADPATRFLPQKDWNGKLLDQWIFFYTKPGKARKFTLHCSLQGRTKRMFIHASEENNLANICVLGLQLENYISRPNTLASNSWRAPPGQELVVRNAAKMSGLMTEHVIQPLLQMAEEEQGPPPGAASVTGRSEQQHQQRQGGLLPTVSNWLRQPQGALGARAVNYLTVAAVTGLVLGFVGLVVQRARGPLLQRRA